MFVSVISFEFGFLAHSPTFIPSAIRVCVRSYNRVLHLNSCIRSYVVRRLGRKWIPNSNRPITYLWFSFIHKYAQSFTDQRF